MSQTESDGDVEMFENARVVQHGPTSYYIPLDLGEVDVKSDTEKIVTQHASLVSFTRNEDSKRDPSRRAVYWALLQERVADNDENFPLVYDPRVKETKSTDEITLPLRVALTTNKAVYAAYLAAHGKSNSFLADALGVSTSTISQYLSDFKSKRR